MKVIVESQDLSSCTEVGTGSIASIARNRVCFLSAQEAELLMGCVFLS